MRVGDGTDWAVLLPPLLSSSSASAFRPAACFSWRTQQDPGTSRHAGQAEQEEQEEE